MFSKSKDAEPGENRVKRVLDVTGEYSDDFRERVADGY